MYFDGTVAPDPNPITHWAIQIVTFDIAAQTSTVSVNYFCQDGTVGDFEGFVFTGAARQALLLATSTAQPNEALLLDANGNPDLDAIYRGRIKPFLLAHATPKYPLS